MKEGPGFRKVRGGTGRQSRLGGEWEGEMGGTKSLESWERKLLLTSKESGKGLWRMGAGLTLVWIDVESRIAVVRLVALIVVREDCSVEYAWS